MRLDSEDRGASCPVGAPPQPSRLPGRLRERERERLSSQRKHRGPHPEDQRLFAASHWQPLRSAAGDLSWLLTRDYALPSALKLVGDRYQLDARQRLAVARCACAEPLVQRRQRHQISPADLPGCSLWIDGFNALTSIEAALAGGVILVGRDGCYRDLASMHGSYRRVEETVPAILLLGALLAELQVGRCQWLLDQPVSNSGRLKTILGQLAAERNWDWQIELVPDPDAVLIRSDSVVATSDSQILNRANRWFNLARTAIDRCVPDARIVDLSR